MEFKSSKAQMNHIQTNYPKATHDAQYNYYCVKCKHELRAYYSLLDGMSIGLQCPACGQVHSF